MTTDTITVEERRISMEEQFRTWKCPCGERRATWVAPNGNESYFYEAHACEGGHWITDAELAILRGASVQEVMDLYFSKRPHKYLRFKNGD